MSEGMGGMDHGDGMMSEADMTALESATGADATRLFLEGMNGHHQGAVQMAQSVIDNGQNPTVADLAPPIIDGQPAEITTMQAILGTPSAAPFLLATPAPSSYTPPPPPPPR